MKIGRRATLAGTAAILAAPFARASTTTITVQYAWPQSFRPILDRIIEAFTATNPGIRVETVRPASDYEELAQRTLREGMTGGLPDVAFHGMHRVGLLADRGLLVPLRPLITADSQWNTLGYAPSMLTLTQQRGEPYGLPFAMSIQAVYYNLDLVRRAGGNPDALPANWPGIIALQRQIQALGAPVTGLYFDYYYPDNNFSFHGLVNSQGGEMATEDDRSVAFNGPEGMQALRWLRGIGEAGLVDMTIAQAYQAFAAGTMGILVASSSRITQLLEASSGRFAVKVGPIPVSPGVGRRPAGGAAAMIHTRDPVKQQAAWSFVKFATGPVGSTAVVLGSGYIPGNARAADDPALLGRFYAEHPYHRLMLDQLPIVSRFYTWPGENSLKIPNIIRDHLQRVVTLRATPEAVMPAMARDVQALLPA